MGIEAEFRKYCHKWIMNQNHNYVQLFTSGEWVIHSPLGKKNRQLLDLFFEYGYLERKKQNSSAYAIELTYLGKKILRYGIMEENMNPTVGTVTIIV